MKSASLSRPHRGAPTFIDCVAVIAICGSLLVIANQLRVRARAAWVRQTTATAAPVAYLQPLLSSQTARPLVVALDVGGATCPALVMVADSASASLPLVITSVDRSIRRCTTDIPPVSEQEWHAVARLMADSGAASAIVDGAGRALYASRDPIPPAAIIRLLAAPQP